MRQAVVDRRERERGGAFDVTPLMVEPQVELQMFDLYFAVGRVMFGARDRFALNVGRRVVQIDLRPLARVEQSRVNEWVVDGHDWRSFGISPASCKPLSREWGTGSGRKNISPHLFVSRSPALPLSRSPTPQP